MSVFKTEKDILLEKMWEIVLRETKVEDDAGCDWFTDGNYTYVGGFDWCVSDNPEIANLVNAINALKGYPELINVRS